MKLIHTLAAACLAAAVVPAQDDVVYVRSQDPKAAKKSDKAAEAEKVRIRIAEVIAMLEEDEMSPAERKKAKKKLQEIVARLKKIGGKDASSTYSVRVIDEKGRPVEGRVAIVDPWENKVRELEAKKKARDGNIAVIRRRIADLSEQSEELERSHDLLLKRLHEEHAELHEEHGEQEEPGRRLRERAEELRGRIAELHEHEGALHEFRVDGSKVREAVRRAHESGNVARARRFLLERAERPHEEHEHEHEEKEHRELFFGVDAHGEIAVPDGNVRFFRREKDADETENEEKREGVFWSFEMDDDAHEHEEGEKHEGRRFLGRVLFGHDDDERHEHDHDDDEGHGRYSFRWERDRGDERAIGRWSRVRPEGGRVYRRMDRDEREHEHERDDEHGSIREMINDMRREMRELREMIQEVREYVRDQQRAERERGEQRRSERARRPNFYYRESDGDRREGRSVRRTYTRRRDR